ncbi:helix-turn-helix domain-containing protein [Streptomyces sp. NPDC056222]|uniref:helix-turn-helix domain-containing protein n=1 Tax=Streptomyces sp. NPDC056222 TaxID=3345749 RepID=UPI0035E134DB
MPRGRPEKPVDETIPELAELATRLRAVRHGAGLTLDQLAGTVNWSKAMLQAATTGTTLPGWRLVEDWAKVCDPATNLDLWRSRYAEARRAHRAHHGLDHAPNAAEDPPGSSAVPMPGDEAPLGTLSPLRAAAQHTLASGLSAWNLRSDVSAGHGVGPLPIRFIPAPVDLMDGPPQVDFHGHFGDLRALFTLLPSQRLVILGQQGSGKSELAGHLGRALQHGKAVPVRVSLAEWRPQYVSLLEWIAHHLPHLPQEHFSAERVSVLLGAGELLPILDDFDAVDPRYMQRALEEIDSCLTGVILVSETDPFRVLVESTNTPLARSSGIVLCPLQRDDLKEWLPQTNRSADAALVHSKWEPVLASTEAPELWDVLSAPSMACAARQAFSDGRADPADLLGKSRHDIERQVIESGYLPAVAKHACATGYSAPHTADRFQASLALFLRQPARPDGSRTVGGAGWQPPKRPYLTLLIAVLAFFYTWVTLAEDTISSHGEYDGSLPMRLVPYAVVAAVIIAAMMHPVVTRPPSAVIRTEPHPAMLRALASRASLPALPCVLCSLITTLTGGPSAAVLGPFFAVYAAAFVGRAAFSDANPRQHTLDQGPRPFSRERRSAWLGLELLIALFMVSMTLSGIPSTIQENTSEATTLVAASAVLGTALLLTILAGTLAAPNWARCYFDRHDRKGLNNLSDTLKAARNQGLLVVDEGAYHFTDAVLARHYAGALPHSAADLPVRTFRWGGQGA